MGTPKMQDWNLEDNFAGLENGGLENAGLSKAALCTIKGDRLQVAHPNLCFHFWYHLQRATVDYMTDKRRHDNGLSIRRPRKKTRQQN